MRVIPRYSVELPTCLSTNPLPVQRQYDLDTAEGRLAERLSRVVAHVPTVVAGEC